MFMYRPIFARFAYGLSWQPWGRRSCGVYSKSLSSQNGGMLVVSLGCCESLTAVLPDLSGLHRFAVTESGEGVAVATAPATLFSSLAVRSIFGGCILFPQQGKKRKEGAVVSHSASTIHRLRGRGPNLRRFASTTDDGIGSSSRW